MEMGKGGGEKWKGREGRVREGWVERREGRKSRKKQMGQKRRKFLRLSPLKDPSAPTQGTASQVTFIHPLESPESGLVLVPSRLAPPPCLQGRRKALRALEDLGPPWGQASWGVCCGGGGHGGWGGALCP